MATMLRCVSSEGYSVSLTVGRVYLIAETEPLDRDGDGHVRIIDNTGDSHLYPRRLFEAEKHGVLSAACAARLKKELG